jgi:hypothetical protein
LAVLTRLLNAYLTVGVTFPMFRANKRPIPP